MSNSMSPQSQLFHALLFASFLITRIISLVEIREIGVTETNAVPPELIGKGIDEFLIKLEELKQNQPKVGDGKHASLCKETQVALEYLEKILAFLKLLNELTEKMKPYRKQYRSLATFDDRFHADCTKSIEEIKKIQDLDNINPHYTTFYYNVENFLEKKLLFADIKGNDIMAQKMLVVRQKIKQYLASLQVKKLILNYHVHTLTTFGESTNQLVKPQNGQKWNPFLITKFGRLMTRTNAKLIGEMQAANAGIYKYLQEIYYKKKGAFSIEYYEAHRAHELMNGAARELVNLLLEILRNILAGGRANPKSLETTWILAHDIVLTEFDEYTDMPKGSEQEAYKTAARHLQAKLSLPNDWIKRESAIMQDDNGKSYAKLQAQIRYYSGIVLLIFLTLKEKSILLCELNYDESQEKEEELTNALSHLPENFGELLERDYTGRTLPKSKNATNEKKYDPVGKNGTSAKKPASVYESRKLWKIAQRMRARTV